MSKKKEKVSIPDLEKELKLAKAKLINKSHNDATDLANAKKLIDDVEKFNIKGNTTKRRKRLTQQLNLINNEIDKLGAKQERRKHKQIDDELRHDATNGIPNRLLRMAKSMHISSEDLEMLIELYGMRFLANCSGGELYDTYMNEGNSIYQGSDGKYYYDVDEIKDVDFDTYNTMGFSFI